MQHWRHLDLARPFGNHLMQGSHFTDQEPEAQREGPAQDHTLCWCRVCLPGRAPSIIRAVSEGPWCESPGRLVCGPEGRVRSSPAGGGLRGTCLSSPGGRTLRIARQWSGLPWGGNEFPGRGDAQAETRWTWEGDAAEETPFQMVSCTLYIEFVAW